MRYQVVIATEERVRRISFKNKTRAMAEYIWWEKRDEMGELMSKLISIKVIDKETNEIIFEKNYKEG